MKKLFLFLIFPLSLTAQHTLIDSGDSKLHYRVFGTGKPLLVINGGPGMNSNGFADLAETLSKDRMAIIYDQRGTGESSLSEISSKTISMDLMVRDIEILRNHLKIEKWDILGHSFGGMLAAYYLSKFPQSIEKVIFSSSGGIDVGLLEYVRNRTNSLLTQTERDSLDYWNAKISSGDNGFRARLGRGRALAPAYVYDRSNAPKIARRLTEGNMEINNLIWQDLRRIGFDCSQAAGNFKNPVLVVQGRNDILEIATAQKIKDAFPRSELVLLDRCGHYGWLDKPEEYFAAIEKFLKS